MCGINGFNFEDKLEIIKMNKAIKHRGPDDEGSFVSKNLSLGHLRLSILDLSNAGHQPMFYNKILGASSETFHKFFINNSQVSIVFNGEIYNYSEIKEELKLIGYVFTTTSDTEVILASYLEWGEKCVEKFNGMWAFCIYDLKTNKLFCSRDRLGVKPFYYYFKNGKFIFSSELKAILEHKNLKLNTKKNLNKEAIELYFSLGFIPSPLTIYNDVYKLEASQCLIFNLDENHIEKVWKFYEISDFKPTYNKKKLIAEGKSLLRDAVKIRMRSDVAVGAFLSGGLDSSSVVGFMKDFTQMKNLHTFSIGFEGKEFDETKYINIVKDDFQTKHHHKYFKKADFDLLLEKFSEIYDEPFGDYSAFPTLDVNHFASEFVTVVLSGDGGDEIFGGYNIHLVGARMDFIKKIPKILRVAGSKIPAKKNMNSFFSLYSLKNAFQLSLEKPESFYSESLKDERYKPLSYSEWTTERLKETFKKGGGNYSESLRIFDLLHNSLADNFLVKVDRASMAYGIEVRSPFLDYRFIEFAQRIPSDLKVDIFKTKKLMREIIKDVVPEEIYTRNKQGFTPPLEKWILNDEYKPKLAQGLKLIENIDKDLYKYYKEKVFKEKNKVYINDKIRLFLFVLWYDKWVK